jgi:hypothetical protein
MRVDATYSWHLPEAVFYTHLRVFDISANPVLRPSLVSNLPLFPFFFLFLFFFEDDTCVYCIFYELKN